jgi:hypothetical protein
MSLVGAGSEEVRLYLDHSRAPTTIGDLVPEDVVVTFQDFAIHVLSQQERGHLVPEDEVWKYGMGYIKWFYHVSHPLMSEHVPPYEEVIVE